MIVHKFHNNIFHLSSGDLWPKANRTVSAQHVRHPSNIAFANASGKRVAETTLEGSSVHSAGTDTGYCSFTISASVPSAGSDYYIVSIAGHGSTKFTAAELTDGTFGLTLGQ